MPIFKKGDKVVPFRKTVEGFGDLSMSGAWKRALESGRGYLHVGAFRNGYYVLHSDNSLGGGDYFNESDLYPYVEDDFCPHVEEAPQDLIYYLDKIKELGFIIDTTDKKGLVIISNPPIELEFNFKSTIFTEYHGSMYSLDRFIYYAEKTISEEDGYVCGIVQNGLVIYSFPLTRGELLRSKKQLKELQEKLGKIQIMWYNN